MIFPTCFSSTITFEEAELDIPMLDIHGNVFKKVTIFPQSEVDLLSQDILRRLTLENRESKKAYNYERVELLCAQVLEKAKDPSYKTYTQTAAAIRRVLEKITGFSVPEEALQAFPHSKSLAKLVKILRFPELAEAKIGVKNYSATLKNEGASGTYLMRGRDGEYVGVFKPENEAIGAPDNPKSVSRDNLNQQIGLYPEEQFTYCLREVLAYEFNKGYANVPKTALVKLQKSLTSTKQIGSFQVYIPNSVSPSSLPWQAIYDNLAVEDVHRLAIQDIRWLNADRHEDNLLYHTLSDSLCLIDHGLIFCPTASRLIFYWMNYPQSAKAISESNKRYIREIDLESDEKLLREKGFTCEAAIQRMKIAGLFLKACVERGLTLREIGHFMISGPGVTYSDLSKHRSIKKSYFETHICTPILLGAQAENTIGEHIKKFVEVDWHLTFFRLSIDLQYTKEVIDDGIELLSIDGATKYAGMQSIRIVSIAKSALTNGDYALKPVITTEYTNNSSMLKVSEVAPKIPRAIAIINGGYFHYNDSENATYEYEGAFTKGDPIGTCLTPLGGFRSTPKANTLWATLAIGKTSVEILRKNPYDNSHHFLSELDSAPLIMQNGILNPLGKKSEIESQNSLKPNNPPGDFQRHIHSLHPRSVVALTKDALLFITVDGKNDKLASGMTGEELGLFLKTYPGITDALNLDGGGSTTMWVKDKGIVNSPADGSERMIATVLALVKRDKRFDL